MRGSSKQVMDLIRQGIEENFKRDVQIELNKHALEIAEKVARDVAQRTSVLVAEYNNLREGQVELHVKFNIEAEKLAGEWVKHNIEAEKPSE
jgi:hypothetical protein